jgi:hypothetical protein
MIVLVLDYFLVIWLELPSGRRMVRKKMLEGIGN